MLFKIKYILVGVRSTSNCGDGMCYELYDDLMDFENAEQDCKKRGGSLAEIKSEATNTLLKDMTQKNG